MPNGPDRLALDASVRSTDIDGHLHVASSNISRAAVNGYQGSEIPDHERLGLRPDKIYQLLRDPAELEKAAETFNGKPLLIQHKPQTAADHDHELTVGSVSNVVWKAPFLTAELAVWEASAIEGIETGAQKELSSAYRYVADMTPGEYEGVRYDGVMREITGNHVALVESGRAGSQVVVGDAAINSKGSIHMTTKLSRQALLASGALHAYLRPKLATDGKVDLRPMLANVTAKNWKAELPKLKLALDAALVGKLAKDTTISDVEEILEEAMSDLKEAVADPDDDEDKPAEDEDAETEEEKKARLAKRAADKAAKDAAPDDDKEKKKPAMDAVSRVAMDAAIAAAVSRARTDAETATIARMRAIQEAERIVRPFIGETVIAQDSASAVYKLALDIGGIDLTGVHESAYAAMVKMLPRPGATPAASPRFAQDTASEEAKFRARYPGASKLVRG